MSDRRYGKSTFLVGVGMAAGFLLGGLVAAPRDTQAAPRNQYKVEQLGMRSRQPEALQEMLDQRAEEGWLLQALDHDTMIFRRGAAPRPAPSPSPEQ